MFRRIFRHWFFHNWLGAYKWYRRWYGGRWELWQVDFPVCGPCWHSECVAGERPGPLCRGTPVVEDYTHAN